MIELLKKGILTGIGLASLTKEAIDKFGKELIKHGHLSEKEGKELIHYMEELSERERNTMDLRIETVITRILKTFDVARKEDIRKLEKRIAELEKARIANLSKIGSHEI
ncbi:MAG TPA: polyhydroxyalkanoate synthesis regulator [Candidatus Riflebacteria bacterium]|jgi:polyhydroxyalkanoate synthesis regulator phasin|nr:polyhydroxyalkanoate synthesis regulator [Candidatus Riflebacteria bacterium]